MVGETIAESGFLAVRWQGGGGALNDGVGQGPKNIILQLFKKMSDGMRAPTMRGRSFCRIAVTSRDRSGRGSILGLGQGVLLGLGQGVFNRTGASGKTMTSGNPHMVSRLARGQ